MVLAARVWFRYVLVIAIVVGGLVGFVFTVRGLLTQDQPSFAASILLACLAAAYAFVVAAGVIFWLHPDKTKPIYWALAIQVPWVSLPGFVYKFCVLSGSLAVYANHIGARYEFGFSTDWALTPSAEVRLLQDASVQVGINVPAFVALLLLRRLTKTERDNYNLISTGRE